VSVRFSLWLYGALCPPGGAGLTAGGLPSAGLPFGGLPAVGLVVGGEVSSSGSSPSSDFFFFFFFLGFFCPPFDGDPRLLFLTTFDRPYLIVYEFSDKYSRCVSSSRSGSRMVAAATRRGSSWIVGSYVRALVSDQMTIARMPVG